MSDEVAAIERLDPSDVGALTDLAEARGWGRLPTRWALTLEHCRVWGIRDPHGSGLRGTVSLHSPDGGPAVLGAMLVAEADERQGSGTALLGHAIAAHQAGEDPPATDRPRSAGSGGFGGAGGAPEPDRAGSSTLTLFATPYGQPLYARHGFVEREVIHVHEGPGPQGGPGARARGIVVGPPDEDAVAQLVACDLATGVGDRSALLRSLATLPGAVLARTEAGTAAGVAWPQADGAYLVGPLAADADPDALGVLAVLASAAKEAGAHTLRVDVAANQVGLRAWCKAHALPQVRTATGMVLAGPADPPPAPPAKSRRTLTTQGFG